jgi:hypothetical protein
MAACPKRANDGSEGLGGTGFRHESSRYLMAPALRNGPSSRASRAFTYPRARALGYIDPPQRVGATV